MMKRLWLSLLWLLGWDEYLKLGGQMRSPKWGTVRREYLKTHPFCEVCGGDDDLDIHHCVPFHLKPMLELEEINLITLCTPHHLLFGHYMSWKSWNEYVRDDAVAWRTRILNRPKGKVETLEANIK